MSDDIRTLIEVAYPGVGPQGNRYYEWAGPPGLEQLDIVVTPHGPAEVIAFDHPLVGEPTRYPVEPEVLTEYTENDPFEHPDGGLE